MNYFDTSALVKAFVVEAGTQWVRGLMTTDAFIVTSPLARVEVASALARKLRLNEIDEPTHDDALAMFDHAWPDVARIKPTDDLLREAGTLARTPSPERMRSRQRRR